MLGVGKVINTVKKRTSFTDEEYDELGTRFNRILREAARRESTRRVMSNLLDLFNLLNIDEEGKIRREAGDAAGGITHDEHVRNTMTLAKDISETFTGNKTLDPMVDHLKKISRILRKDPEARETFIEWRRYLKRCLEKPELLGTDQSNKEVKDLAKRTRSLHNEKLNTHMNGAITESKELIKRIDRDPATLRLREDMKRLASDIMLDSEGN